MRATAWTLLAWVLLASTVSADDRELARLLPAVERFKGAVERINERHAAKPGEAREADLARQIPARERATLGNLLALKDGDAKRRLLVEYGRAAAELDLAAELARVEKALEKIDPEALAPDPFGRYISRERFLLHAVRVERKYAEQFAEALDGIFEAFDRTFGFSEFSKVPGKKVRVYLHGEPDPKPPHFAPEFPYHSQIDYPVPLQHGADFTSPTRDGKFLFYGIGHELGHLLAMWGDRRTMEDHHAWAHYTGVAIVDACAKAKWARKLRDRQWRSLEKERKGLKDQDPSFASREGVLRLLIALHDLVGPQTIGAAFNHMEAKRMGHRINHVRYYWMKDFEQALLAVKPGRKKAKELKKLFAAAR